MTGRQPPYGRTVPGNDWSVLDGLAPAEPPLVSVIVVHFEQHDDLERTLLALAAQSYPVDRIEIIVVDDGSVVAPVVPAGVTLVVQQDLGFRASAARNAGVAASTGEVLCFLDADTSPEPGYVAAMVRLPGLAPEAVTVGHRKHAELDGVVDSIEQAGPARELPEPAWLADAYAASRDLLDSDERSYRYLVGAVFACSRWFFDEVGGFDETFTTYGGEDWDWASRAWLAGGIFAHVRGAVAWHNGPDAALRDPASRLQNEQKKNSETVSLLSRIAVPGASGHAIAAAVPDLVVVVPPGEPSAVYQSVDLLLRALPTARVVVDPEFAELFAHDSRIGSDRSVTVDRSRVLIELSSPLRVRRSHVPAFEAALRSASERVGRAGLGSVVLRAANSEERITVTATRATIRQRRWPDAAAWRHEWTEVPLVPIEPGASLAAYLGGWDD